MQHYVYLSAMVASLIGLMIIDWRWKLAWFWRPRRVAVVLGVGQAVFVLWDVANIMAGTFFTNQAWVCGVHLFSPDMPLEEFLFLYFLSYQALLLWRWRCSRISA